MVVIRENKSCLKDNKRWEDKNIDLRGKCNQLEIKMQADKANNEVLQKEQAMIKAWYSRKIDRWISTQELGKKDLEAIHLEEIRTGPSDLTLAEWDLKMVESKRYCHGEWAFNAVFGSNDCSDGKIEDKS